MGSTKVNAEAIMAYPLIMTYTITTVVTKCLAPQTNFLIEAPCPYNREMLEDMKDSWVAAGIHLDHLIEKYTLG